MRDYVKRLLSQRYEVETVSDGLAALEAIAQRPLDLVLSDVMMPRLDGFGLLRELRTNPQTKNIPVILLSARAGEEARIEGLEAGADDYLTKPFSARELLARVEATLKLAQLRKAAAQQEQTLRVEAQAAKDSLESLLARIDDQFLALDRQWRYTYVNDHVTEVTGINRENLLGKSLWEVFPNIVGTQFDIEVRRAVAEQTPVQFEYFYPKWNRWFENHVYPSADGVSIIVTEITDRKQAELMLVEQKRLLELIATGTALDDCLAAVCLAIAQLSPGIRACFLLTDAQGSTFSRSITPDFPPSLQQGVKGLPINELCIGTCGEAVYRGQPIACTDIANDDRWSPNWRELCIAHGVLACHSSPVLGAERWPFGSLMLCFSEARNPTDWEYQLAEFGTQIASIAFERDRANFALRESEQKYRSLFESIDQGFCLIEVLFDAAGKPFNYRFLEVNAAFEQQSGLVDATGKTVLELVPNLEPQWLEVAGQVARSGESIRYEAHVISMNCFLIPTCFPVVRPVRISLQCCLSILPSANAVKPISLS